MTEIVLFILIAHETIFRLRGTTYQCWLPKGVLENEWDINPGGKHRFSASPSMAIVVNISLDNVIGMVW